MRYLQFAKRNFKEILLDPLSWIFMFILPILLFIVLQIMVKAIVDVSYTPQFEINHLTISMIIFSFSFLTIFSGNMISHDKEEKYLLRLKSTPMKPSDFVLGYTLCNLPLAFIQEIIIIIVGLCFGLTFRINLLYLILGLFPISLIFIGFGILFGSLLSLKAVGGVSSIIPTACSLLGGMFFPLDNIDGGFKIVCEIFPFYHAINIGQFIMNEDVNNIILSFIICLIYILIIIYQQYLFLLSNYIEIQFNLCFNIYMENIKVVFIDIDNTLLDFDEYVKETMKNGFKQFSLKEYQPYMYDIFTQENNKLWLQIEKDELTFQELEKIRWNNVFKALDINFDGVVFEKYFRSALYNSAILIDHALEMLSYLNKKYILCVASNGPYNQQIHRLEIANIKKYFSYYFISEKIGYSKPNKEFFKEAFKELNQKINVLPNECMIIGDSLTSDIKGGHEYNMKTCFFNKHKKDIKINENIDYIINNLKKVEEIL